MAVVPPRPNAEALQELARGLAELSSLPAAGDGRVAVVNPLLPGVVPALQAQINRGFSFCTGIGTGTSTRVPVGVAL